MYLVCVLVEMVFDYRLEIRRFCQVPAVAMLASVAVERMPGFAFERKNPDFRVHARWKPDFSGDVAKVFHLD